MAVMQSRDTRTLVAGEDLTTAQFKFVVLGTDAEALLASVDGEACVGVCTSGAPIDRAVTVTKTGSVMVECGGTVTAGQPVATDPTARAVNAGGGDIIMGYAIEDGAANQVIEIELIQGGNAA